MKEHPILFNGEMVRAILEDRKTQTRRVVKLNDSGRPMLDGKSWHINDPECIKACPYGQAGNRLWVRERWAVDKSFDNLPPLMLPVHGMPVYYHATAQCTDYKWRSSIHMPRWASRITLEITDVRVQRLQEISAYDALAEGITHHTMNDPRVEFQRLWDAINAKRGHGWNNNPWVWATNFKRVKDVK